VLTPAAEDWPGYLKRSRNGLGLFHDGGGVYPDLRILEATRILIQAQPMRNIPQENRALVEQATHPDALAAIADAGGEDWQAHQQLVEGDIGAMRTLGHLQRLDFNKHFDEMDFAGNDETISTRLGATDRLLIFDPPQLGPFGEPVRQMAMRHHLLPKNLHLDAQPENIVTNQDGFTFTLGQAHYAYGRMGIEQLRES